ncbi:MAG: reverse transcriptase domain-containing protein [Candidatus Thiodiazotropha endolucinida]
MQRQSTTDTSVNSRLNHLTSNLHKAAEAAVPSKIIKLKGPTWKASPTVRILLKDCKEKYKLWIDSGKTDSLLRSDNVAAKRALRKQLRKEKFNDRKNFYETLMSEPSTEMFYKLIRRNKGGSGSRTSTLIVNGKEITLPDQQRKAFADYYEDLSVPKDKHYDSAFLELCSVRHELITQICEESSLPFESVTTSEVKKAISQLNSKKAPDEFGLTAEHLKFAGKAVIEDITDIFNQIIFEKQVPSAFKSGILTPVLKKSKDPTNMDNYRGITVTPVLGKLFECVLLPRISQTFEQSSLQFGFTKGLSPVMSALIVSEARAEARVNSCAPLFLVTLDSQKAFDVVNHVILLDKLYETGIHPSLWTIVKDMYTGLTSKVKWLGELSDNFKIQQGVRQGGILSPFLYKTYINPCLVELKQHRLGLCIGKTYCGCPTCADDLAFLTNCENELQIMLNVATRNANQDRVTIHPDKSNAVLLNSHKTVTKKSFSVKMGDKSMQLSASTQHLGLFRAEVNENMINIEDRLALARRTLYSLINTGVHGSNGLNPRVSYKIYQCYVLPRLLYGLEVLPLTVSQINVLSKFHLDNLKRFQSLPVRVATCAVYLLLGALPIEAEIHKRQFSLLYNVLTSTNETVIELADRQIAVNLDNNLSYFSRVQEILQLYQLPSIDTLRDSLTTKDRWRYQFKTAVYNYWTVKLKNEACEKSTLRFMNFETTKVNYTHNVWSSMESSVTEVRKGIVKCRMLTGTYLLQTSKHKFSKTAVSATCECCGLGDEDITHMLLECSALHSQRKQFFPKVRSIVTEYIGVDQWNSIFSTKSNLVKLILDCTVFPVLNSETQAREVTKVTTELCYRLHLQRIHKLKQE